MRKYRLYVKVSSRPNWVLVGVYPEGQVEQYRRVLEEKGYEVVVSPLRARGNG